MLEFRKYNNVAGIYMFRNKINDKKYIGQSVNLYKRLRDHLSRIKRGESNKVLYRAIYKYGLENFEITILSTFRPHDQLRQNLNLAEKIYIQFFDTYKNGYNSTLGGDGSTNCKWTKERKDHFQEYFKNNPDARRGKNNPRSKRVYLYNFKEQYCTQYDSCAEAARDLNIDQNRINECARNKRKRAGFFVCAYSKEELEQKSYEFDEWFVENKYKTISPDYAAYFKWLVENADDAGIIPTAAESAKQFNIKASCIPNWNSHIRDKLERVWIGNKLRLKIKNYDEFKNKKIE